MSRSKKKQTKKAGWRAVNITADIYDEAERRAIETSDDPDLRPSPRRVIEAALRELWGLRN